MNEIERLSAAIERALDKAPVADVLSVLTGAFVGLTVELVRRSGQDALGQINVDGGPNRDITIHAVKGGDVAAPRPTTVQRFRIRVKDANGAYTTNTVQGKRASCTHSPKEAAYALGRKLAPGKAWQLDDGRREGNAVVYEMTVHS